MKSGAYPFSNYSRISIPIIGYYISHLHYGWRETVATCRADMSPARKINFSNIIRKNDSFDFTWSFHPIFVWMRIVLGIELSDNRLTTMLVDIAPFRRRFCRWISRFFWGFFVLVVSLSVNILDAVFTYDDTIDSHYLLHEEKMNNVTVSDLMIIRIKTNITQCIIEIAISSVINFDCIFIVST